MGNLAKTYTLMDKINEAEALEILVLEKQTNILGKDHPSTIQTRMNLTSTYNQLGKLKEIKQFYANIPQGHKSQ
jgi:hypothetical protein